MQFSVLQQSTVSPERLVILKNPLHACNCLCRTLHHNRIGTQIDAHMESVLQQSQIFVAGPEQGLQIGRDFELFSHQARK